MIFPLSWTLRYPRIELQPTRPRNPLSCEVVSKTHHLQNCTLRVPSCGGTKPSKFSTPGSILVLQRTYAAISTHRAPRRSTLAMLHKARSIAEFTSQRSAAVNFLHVRVKDRPVIPLTCRQLRTLGSLTWKIELRLVM